MVDAQSQVALEAVHAVVPPTERFLGLIEQTEAVLEPELDQRPEDGPLRLAEQHLSFPGLWIMNVALLRRDVVVPQQNQSRMHLQLRLQPCSQAREPIELIPVLIRLDALAVGNVGADDA